MLRLEQTMTLPSSYHSISSAALAATVATGRHCAAFSNVAYGTRQQYHYLLLLLCGRYYRH